MHWKRYLIGTAGAGLMALVLSAASPQPVFAQLNQPTHQAILDAITVIQNGLNALTAAQQSNFRATPPTGFSTFSAHCHVVNLTNAVRQVRISARDEDGNGGSTVFSIPPGQTRRFIHDFQFAVFPHCTFEVFDSAGNPAPRGDIRGSMNASDSSTEFATVAAE